VVIAPSGDVTTSGANGAQSFRIQLTRFTNPSGLEALGRNLYRETTASGAAEAGSPGEGGFGSLQQHYLEMSNVKVVEEMVNLIVAQRAYEVNSRAIRTSDEMLALTNTIVR
jgi:flagellar basal-body rod protein FlgG